jgi:hypothetical protein
MTMMMVKRTWREPGLPEPLSLILHLFSFVSACRGSASLASVVFGLMMAGDHGLAGRSFSVVLRLAGLAGIIIRLPFTFSFVFQHLTLQRDGLTPGHAKCRHNADDINFSSARNILSEGRTFPSSARLCADPSAGLGKLHFELLGSFNLRLSLLIPFALQTTSPGDLV